MFATLIQPSELASHLPDGWAIVDCRFDLSQPDLGEQHYLQAHIPGARYAHLDRDLSGTKTGLNGRHPLPTFEEMRARFGALGIDASTQVVAYDADTGMYAARLWWMLRYLGHETVAVLDGGFARWVSEGAPVTSTAEQWSPRVFTGDPRANWVVDTAEISTTVAGGSRLLVDARAEGRFRGENETIDARAGHIPGARNRFFQHNLTEDKRFKGRDALRTEWQKRLGNHSPVASVMYCGSGVTACHNLLALEHAGLPGAALYPGSWSEWSSDPLRPIETDGERE